MVAIRFVVPLSRINPEQGLMSSQGIFRDVHLLAFPSETRIEDWFLRGDINGVNGYLDARVDTKTTSTASLVVTIREQPRYGGKTLANWEKLIHGDEKVKIYVDIPEPSR